MNQQSTETWSQVDKAKKNKIANDNVSSLTWSLGGF